MEMALGKLGGIDVPHFCLEVFERLAVRAMAFQTAMVARLELRQRIPSPRPGMDHLGSVPGYLVEAFDVAESLLSCSRIRVLIFWKG